MAIAAFRDGQRGRDINRAGVWFPRSVRRAGRGSQRLLSRQPRGQVGDGLEIEQGFGQGFCLGQGKPANQMLL
jgi:hypothetical protein